MGSGIGPTNVNLVKELSCFFHPSTRTAFSLPLSPSSLQLLLPTLPVPLPLLSASISTSSSSSKVHSSPSYLYLCFCHYCVRGLGLSLLDIFHAHHFFPGPALTSVSSVSLSLEYVNYQLSAIRIFRTRFHATPAMVLDDLSII